MLYISDSQTGVRAPPGVQSTTFRGMQKKLNNGGKRHICQQCKTSYNSKVVKLIECYDERQSKFSSLFDLEKSPRSLALLFWRMVGTTILIINILLI
jgi:predicted secreted Zn-dependent protease